MPSPNVSACSAPGRRPAGAERGEHARPLHLHVELPQPTDLCVGAGLPARQQQAAETIIKAVRAHERSPPVKSSHSRSSARSPPLKARPEPLAQSRSPGSAIWVRPLLASPYVPLGELPLSCHQFFSCLGELHLARFLPRRRRPALAVHHRELRTEQPALPFVGHTTRSSSVHNDVIRTRRSKPHSDSISSASLRCPPRQEESRTRGRRGLSPPCGLRLWQPCRSSG